MNPIDPSSEPVDLTPIPNPQPPIASPDPFFDYTDLFFFVGFCVPGIFIALLLVRLVRIFAPMPMAIQLLLVQSVWYFLVFGSLAALFRMRYDRPFWQSLGWRPISFSGAAGAVLAGPLLAVSVGLLGSALRTPEIDLPFEANARLYRHNSLARNPGRDSRPRGGGTRLPRIPDAAADSQPRTGRRHRAHGRHLWQHSWL